MFSIVYIAVIKHYQKQYVEVRLYFILQLNNASWREAKTGTQGRSLKQKTTDSLSGSPSATFLIQARPNFPRMALPTVGPSTSIGN